MRLGSYELGRELGRGAQGVVYRGVDTRSGDVVAVKALHPCPERDPGSRVWSEGLARLSHPGICPVHDMGRDGDRSFVVMEYLRGQTLRCYLRECRRVPGGDAVARTDEAVRLVEGLARAAHAAHESGVVHRDIKPSNVMLVEDGRGVLLDFGLSPADISTGPAGTPAYMAPEQVRSGAAVDRRADVHALGAVLYELVTLERPFRGATQHGILREVLRRQVRAPDSVSPALAAILETALAKRPHERYASSMALAEDLARFRRGEAVWARRPGPWRRLARWMDAHRGAAALGAALLAALALVAFLAQREARSARSLRRQLVRYADLERTTRLVEEESSGPWVVDPDGLADLEAWVSEAEGILERQAGEDASAADLSELPALAASLERTRERAADARSLAERTIERYTARWRDPEFCSPGLAPQVGLVPLGRDPRSGLLEFAHAQSGDAPERDPGTGELELGPESAIVLVLVPGGTFTMGGTSSWAQRRELPAHPVTLDAFFLSKFEMTVAQWVRLAGDDPTNGARGDPAVPVYQVSWTMAMDLLPRWGLTLPTEAQWEYAARAGTETPWSCGTEPASLAGHANLWDRTRSRQSSQGKAGVIHPRLVAAPEIDDGFGHIAPVGRFLPNAFGLFDVHGNALELVRDAYGSYALPVRAGDGERLEGRPSLRIGRGGAFNHGALELRSAARFEAPPGFRSYQGCRPARAISGH